MKKVITIICSLLLIIGMYALSVQMSSYSYVLDLSGPWPEGQTTQSIQVENSSTIKIIVEKKSNKIWNISIIPEVQTDILYREKFSGSNTSRSVKSIRGKTISMSIKPRYLLLKVLVFNGNVETIQVMEQNGIAEGAQKIKDGIYLCP